MSYNISTIEYIGPGRLTITSTDLGRAMIELRGKAPEGSFIDDTTKLRALSPDVLEITRVDWCGEGALIIWEGGDSISGLRVNDGEVTEHVVDIKLGEPMAEAYLGQGEAK